MTDMPNTVTKDQLDNLIAKSNIEYVVFDNKLTVAVITLPTNFKIVGQASCVDANNFDKVLGEKYALENAVEKLWELEGYLLANDIYREVFAQDKGVNALGINIANQFDFGLAIHALKAGKKLARKGWNGSGMFVYYVPAASYPMQRNNLETMGGIFPDDMVPYREYLALKTAQGDVSTWSPSVSDALATDWQVVV